MDRDGTGKRVLNEKLDREAQNPVWAKDGSGLYFQYTDRGNTKIGFIDLEGKVQTLAEFVGGTEIGRPYSSGSFSVGGDGVLAFLHHARVIDAMMGTIMMARMMPAASIPRPYIGPVNSPVQPKVFASAGST